MIPQAIIDQWREKAPWPLDDQVEQDLVISRALVEIFNHEYLKDKIAFRGGTALHKLVFPEGLRYSEDIDLNRLENGPAKPIFDGVREALFEMLGEPAKTKTTTNSLKLLFDYTSIFNEKRRLKIEINVRETLPEYKLEMVPFSVESDYFTGKTTILAFDKEEMIGTKIRALYQRNKGRDLFDLYTLFSVEGIDWDKVIESFKKLNIGATQLLFTQNLNDKMSNPEFLEDIDPLLRGDITYDPHEAHFWFSDFIIPKL